MSLNTESRARNSPTPAVVISFVRSPRMKLTRSPVYGVASPALITADIAVLAPMLVHSNGMPAVPLQVSMTRLVGSGLGDTLEVEVQAPPVRLQLASQAIVPADRVL